MRGRWEGREEDGMREGERANQDSPVSKTCSVLPQDSAGGNLN